MDEYCNQAQQHEADGDLENAVIKYYKCIELNNDHAEAHNGLAWLLSTRHTYLERAIYHAKKAVEIEPQQESYWDTLAEAYFGKGDYGSALEACQRALELEPIPITEFLIYLRIGRIYQAQQKLSMAIEAFKNAERINAPSPPYDLADVYFGLAGCYATLDDHEAAARTYEKSLDFRPNEPFIKNSLAGELMSLQPPNLNKAKEYLKQALTGAPQMGLTYFNLACVSGMERDCKSAAEWFEQGIPYFDEQMFERAKDAPALELCRHNVLIVLRDHAKISEAEFLRLNRLVHPQPNSEVVRNQVFISYSHKDEKWRNELVEMFHPLEKKIKFWYDTKIRSGARWREEIRTALASAKVAVLLVSPNYLSSDFIEKHELPYLLETAKNEGLTILWILLSACLYEETELDDYHAAYDPAKPLDALKPAEQNQALAELSREIKEAVEG